MNPDEREPEYWLNYKGDVRTGFNMLEPKGPTYNNEFMWPIESHYDPKTNITRVGFSKQMPPQLLPTSQENADRARLQAIEE